MAYPSSNDTYTAVSGTTLVASADHANMHNVVGSAVVALETKLGLGAGTPTATNKLLVGTGNGTAIWGGTVNGLVLGTPTITSGTFNNAAFGTPAITGGTINSAVIGTPAITGGTITGAVTIPQLYAPQGFLINGKISVTVSTNNLTVAIKTIAGNNPSSTDPVYCRIGDTIRSVTSALSITVNAGTNWFNAGSSELATNEIDYFVYLGYNATDGVVIGFSRIPYAQRYNDFNTTSTNDHYCAISTITNAAATDYYENIGRFAATLSASASYNWSVPTFTGTNLIQHLVSYTRWLSLTGVFTGFSSNPTGGNFRYMINGNSCICKTGNWTAGTSNATGFTIKAPITMANVGVSSAGHAGQVADNGVALSTPGNCYILANNNSINIEKDMGGGAFTTSGGKSATFTGFIYEI